ncbi:hypothetical protein BET03_07330 [Thermohalobacter berrensis]|uniref:Uncharacterized protein n=1 Tax=Thermohalobacter berrensis TaxID=99594 RepID=A0A419SUH7_9FIRM|nr:hypothetical protein BET03_07330 [Thermohalobacter berrensis]
MFGKKIISHWINSFQLKGWCFLNIEIILKILNILPKVFKNPLHRFITENQYLKGATFYE